MKSYSEIEGDGGSDVVRQIVDLHGKIKERFSKVKKLLLVGSAKGGVGKSTVVTQLANTFNSMNLRVGILDADINGPSQVRLTGLKDAILIPEKDGLLPPRTPSGIALLSFASLFDESVAVDFKSVAKGDSHTWRATREFSALGELLASTIWNERDVFIVDLPPGAERTLQFVEFLSGVTGLKAEIVIVSTPSDVSRGIVKRGLAALPAAAHVHGLIENMSGYFCKECNELKPLFPRSNKVVLEIPILGSVPFEPELAKLCDEGKPITEAAGLISLEALSSICKKILGDNNEISLRAV